MDKVKLLMEKYNLPEDVAMDAKYNLDRAALFYDRKIKKPPTTKANIDSIRKIIEAEPIGTLYLENIRKIECIEIPLTNFYPPDQEIKLKSQGWYRSVPLNIQYRTAYIGSTPIESVTFRINGVNYKITDGRVADQLRIRLMELDKEPELRPAHGPKDPAVYYLTKAARLLFDSMPNDIQVNVKEYTINDIFCLFLRKWKGKDIEKVRNYLRNK
ncbi:MAG: hypothetical protein Q8S18_00010 [Bacteroidales bacterium]|nr:hypothetical protein [Bacteroidales bacterium]